LFLHNSFRINTCKSVSKHMTLTAFRINTYEKHRGEGARYLLASPRHCMRHAATLSPPPSTSCAYFPSPRGCTPSPFPNSRPFRPVETPTLLPTNSCGLFRLSLLSFLHSLPLFSIVCSLFLQNTRVGGIQRLNCPHKRQEGTQARALFTIQVNYASTTRWRPSRSCPPLRLPCCTRRRPSGAW